MRRSRTFMVAVILVAVSILLASAGSAPAQIAKASWYGEPFHGRTAADGSTYNMYELTAAHRTLPFGTIVRVTNAENGKTVRVRITDRGPYISGRNLDLSYAAAKAIGLAHEGVGTVLVHVVQKPKDRSEDFYEYRVRQGETLYSLFGKEKRTIMRINGIQDPKELQAGRKLLVPYWL